ncbi:MAG: hypothetical protein KAR33_10445 [Candidatus Thorarchaeota archaeon]|nr:hypothetical protein [Candidatus Thorarchaeota archaeon]
MVEKNWDKEKGEEDPAETIALLRDGVFGALGLHSLSLALEIPTRDVIDILLKGKTWTEGRKKARAFCSMQASQLISKQNLDYLDSLSLNRDGLGYLVPQLEDACLKQYRKVRPKVEKGFLILKPLGRSVYGRTILRTFGISQPTIKASDEQGKQLLAEYDNHLIELETDTSRTVILDGPTEQLTLEGEPVAIEEEITKEPAEVEPPKKGVQAPLSEYIPSKKKKVSAKEASRKRRKGRRAKKAKGAKEEKK